MKRLTKVRRAPKNILAQSLGIRLTPEEQAAIEKCASDEFLSRASFLRRMILRGLADYKRELASNP
ncbi:hypothetical protein [Glaciimonas sp. PCH181]|uniref:hypothetical protein n=1 Tax=Glaciimonas sp. PCH181 TaxID=2133943 RepID=UPI0011B2008E|nr:hypothetical protein [Glaciimonas sp. PCH181]